MNNKLIALAVASAFAAPMAAQAAPTVYGIGQVEYSQLSNTTSAAAASSNIDRTEVSDNKMGRFGIKGSEDLGDGLKAVYLMEFGIDTTDNNFDSTTGKGGDINGIFKRESSIGLKIGADHTILMGNLKSPYKYSGGVKYDSFVATSLQAREGSSNTTQSVGGAMSGGDFGQGGFLANSFSYQGNFKPVSVWVLYSPSEEDNSSSSNATNGVAGPVSALGVDANVGAFNFGAATISKDSCLATSTSICGSNVSEVTASKLYGSWSAGQHTVRLQVENREVTAATSGAVATETDFQYVNYQFKMGKHLVDVALGNLDDKTTSLVKDVSWSRLAYAYNFSKQTRVFAGIASREVDGAATTDTDVVSVGMTVKF